MDISLISHVFNESYLLPFWIKHHRQMFDSATIIDYSSTDETIAILKKYAPSTWNVVRSVNSQFEASACDLEVMEIEKSIEGWKIALTATEFLIFPEMQNVLDNLEARSKNAVRISGYAMVDPADLDDQVINPNEPLWSEFHYGVPEYELCHRYPPSETSRPMGRLLHANATGQYLVGRHAWRQDDGELPRSVASILWYGFSPWTPNLVGRKAQIRNRIPAGDLLAGRGTHHHERIDQIEETRQKYLELSYDLNSLLEFRQVTGAYDSSSKTLEPELHMNSLPFGHKFGPLDLAQYVNSHFGIESESENKAWEYLAHLKALEQSNEQINRGLSMEKLRRLLWRK